ncbi:ATP-binding protein [Alteromonas sp. S167]|uniref:ATP-binding protein n=1 Tax=Alteromonas sp. S167 TaxID=3117402 RepID=UPI002FE35935
MLQCDYQEKTHDIVHLNSQRDIDLLCQHCKLLCYHIYNDDFKSSYFATGVSEIATNALRYAKNVTASTTLLENLNGLVVTIEDKGTGIPDLARAFQNGYSTHRSSSLGLGLNAARNAVDEFVIQKNDKNGLSIALSFFAPPRPQDISVDYISFPAENEYINHDRVLKKTFDGEHAILGIYSVANRDLHIYFQDAIDQILNQFFRLDLPELFKKFHRISGDGQFPLSLLKVCSNTIEFIGTHNMPFCAIQKQSANNYRICPLPCSHDGITHLKLPNSENSVLAIGSLGVDFTQSRLSVSASKTDTYTLATHVFNQCAKSNKDATLQVIRTKCYD